MLLQLGEPGPQVGDPRLKLHTVNHAVSIPVYQPPDPAPQGANAALDLPDVGIGLTLRCEVRQAAPVLVSDPLRIIENRLDMGPHDALETITAHRAVGAHRLSVEPVSITADAAIGAVTEGTGAMALSKPRRGFAVIGIATPPTHNQPL